MLKNETLILFSRKKIYTCVYLLVLCRLRTSCNNILPPRFPLEQRAQGESFLFFLPCSVFSYSINVEEDRSDIDKFVINHIIIGKQ